MHLNFDISEFCITDDPIDQQVADKILKYHILELQPIRDMIGLAIVVSQKSGYRPKYYELQKGRSGNSEHTFQGKGAADLTCVDMGLLVEYLKTESNYTRIAYYPDAGFVHVDYKPTPSGRREFYHSTNNSRWTFKEFLS